MGLSQIYQQVVRQQTKKASARFPADPALQPYWVSSNPRRELRFWLRFALETLYKRRVSKVVKLRLAELPPTKISGLENLPQTGTYTLATNHYLPATTLDVLAVTLAASHNCRPELTDSFVIVVGRRNKSKLAWQKKLIRFGVDKVFYLWRANTIRIGWSNQKVSIQALREWRKQTQLRPFIVFPEGKASLSFGLVRAGAGRWLASFRTPVIPTAVWWHNNQWHVRFGHGIKWSHRAELLDLQLGLSIAALLPQELGEMWSDSLKQWHAAHEN